MKVLYPLLVFQGECCLQPLANLFGCDSRFRTHPIRNQDHPGLLMACVFIIDGMKTSVTTPGSVPMKPFGATPTIWYWSFPMRNVLPSALGSRPKRRVQKS